MRYSSVLVIDVMLLLCASVAALLLRDNLAFSFARLAELAPYFLSTAVMAAAVLHFSGLSRISWRFSSLPDYLRLIAAVTGIVIGTVLLTFVANRLTGVARSLPVLQFMLGTAVLIGARISSRLHFSSQQQQRVVIKQLKISNDPAVETVLVVGLSRLAETYLQAVTELAPGRVRIAGLLGHAERQLGRHVAGYQVFGRPEHVERVLADLDVHGVKIDRIVVTDPARALSTEAREALARMERSGRAAVRFLSEDLGLEPAGPELTARETARQPLKMKATESRIPQSKPVELKSVDARPADPDTQLSFVIAPAELDALAASPHWQIKRAIDVVASGLLIALFVPTLAVIWLLVAATTGFPVTFWQQRPGLGGRPFKVFKFRTMADAYSAEGRRLSDAERTTQTGSFLRRTRLDELPQLFSIFRGDMSFVGPRPLLPCDQSEAYRARLLVRPGLTGWAQVIGGRTISAEDKAALDVWYVCNASLLLDLKIIGRTVPMVLYGERTDPAVIKSTWDDLRDAGVVRGR